MFKDKKAFEAELKEYLKSKGREELMEAIEETVDLAYGAVKILVKHTDNGIDDMALAALDSTVKDLIDKIDGKENL